MKEDDINMYDDNFFSPRNVLKREFVKLSVINVLTIEQSNNFIELIDSKEPDNFKIARECYRTLSRDCKEELNNLSEEIAETVGRINAFNMICNSTPKLYEINELINKYIDEGNR